MEPDAQLAAHLTQEQADEYALGALPAETAGLMSLHVEECDACRALVADSRWLASMIGLSAPRRTAPPKLRKRVLRAVRTGRSPVWTIARFTPAAAAAAAIVVAVASFTGMVSVRGQIRQLRDTNASLDAQIDDALGQKVEIAALTRRLSNSELTADQMAAAAKDDRELLVALLSPESKVAEVVALEDMPTVGRLVWDDSQKKVFFVATGMPRTGQGETYQLWVSSGGRFVSLGTFGPDETGFVRFETTVPQDLQTYESAVVTIEQAGGSATRGGGRTVMATDLSNLRR